MPYGYADQGYSDYDSMPQQPQQPSPYVPAQLRQLLHYSVSHNKEVQVEVTNFRKDGSRWENVLSIVPIHWDDDDVRQRSSKTKTKNQPRRYRYSVGFACDKIAMGM